MKIAIEKNMFTDVKLLFYSKEYSDEFLGSFYVKLVEKSRFDMIGLLVELGIKYINNDALMAVLNSSNPNVEILDKFLPPIDINDKYYQAIQDAMSTGQFDIVKKLIQYCHDGDVLKTFFNMSIREKYTDIMWLFLDKKLSFNNTTIEIAIISNNSEALTALLQTEYIIPTEMLNYYIIYAYNNNYAEIVRILLDTCNASKYTHYNFCMKYDCLNQRIGMIKILMEKGETPYTDIIYTDDTIAITTLILSKGYNISSPDTYCMQYACLNGHTEIVEILMRRGIDPCINDNICIENACMNGYTDIVGLLMNSGKITRLSKNIDNLIMKACEYGYTKIVELLLNNNDIDPCIDNNYCIKQVCLGGHVEILRLLLNDYRADPICDNNYCIINAYKRGHFNIVNELLWDGRTQITQIELDFKYS
jgi:ankyrin repeat protein